MGIIINKSADEKHDHSDEQRRPLHWVGSSLDDLKGCPENVKDEVGYALDVAQSGGKHDVAKPLKGFGDAGVLEIIAKDDGNTYRAVYTVKFALAIYVLHVFQKKSNHGIKTPQREIDLIKRRLKSAADAYKQQYGANNHG